MKLFGQSERPITFEAQQCVETLLLAGFRGTEGISRLFSFELDLLSEIGNIAFEDIIGKPALVTMQIHEGAERVFHGIICRFSQLTGRDLGSEFSLARYRATMVPWTWLLTRTTDSRIFQNLTVPEIIKKIFEEKKFAAFSIETQEQHDKREFCVQYNETDFNFISRLMEEEGIYYYFTHDAKSHTMVIADTPGKHKKIERPVRFQMSFSGGVGENTVSALYKTQEIQAGKFSLSDFNFEIPKTKLVANVDSQQHVGPGEREMYEYPGGYAAKAVGDRLTRIRMEEQEARITTIEGSSNCVDFTCGYRFKLVNAPQPDMDQEYLLTTVMHTASQEWEGKSETSYTNEFTCVPFSTPFRPERTSRKPLIYGSQTAIVVGKSGDEIYTDKHGRIKVQFHWDREGKSDENSSCWIRVGQIWAGQGWGAFFIPRVGHEVIIDFLEGDPDRPIVTGRVYHGINTPPYALPDNATQSGVKSNSSKGGTAENYNEIRFEDKKGAEQILIHAEMNMDTSVEKDETHDVGGNRKMHVAGHFTENIDSGEERTVSAGSKETISGGQNIIVSGGLNETINGGEERTVVGTLKETVSGSETKTIGASLTQTVGGSVSQTVGGTFDMIAGGPITITAPSHNVVTPKKSALESVFDQVGISTSACYAIAYAVTGFKAEYTTVALALNSVNIALTGLKLERCSLVCANEPVKLGQSTANIWKKAFSVASCGIYCVS